MVDREKFVYSGIRVRDLSESLRFYRRLGFREVKRGWFSHGGQWVHLVFPGSDHRLELNYYPPGTPFYRPFRAGEEFDHFGFYVSNPRRWLRSMLRAGAKPVVGYVDGPAQLLYVTDPNGVCLGSCGPSTPGSLPNMFPPERTRGRRLRPRTGRSRQRGRPPSRRRSHSSSGRRVTPRAADGPAER